MEFLFLGFLAIVLIAYLGLAIQIPHQSVPADVIEANGFPILISVTALVLLAFATAEAVKKRRADTAAGVEKERITLSKNAITRLAIVVGLIVFYIFSLRTIGFITAMAIFLFGSTTAMGSRRYVFNLIFAVGLTVILTLVFGQLFMIMIPRGVGIFRELSFLLH
ncbi:MAG: tripartite tricarboxylate transporter TctB family protein [Oscillospiraceae bacterium]|nr:tripartite tricarboxylate transporter TctB family protein [Oscillospiraceae bacterium]